jgi:hypothetical protein
VGNIPHIYILYIYSGDISGDIPYIYNQSGVRPKYIVLANFNLVIPSHLLQEFPDQKRPDWRILKNFVRAIINLGSMMIHVQLKGSQFPSENSFK